MLNRRYLRIKVFQALYSYFSVKDGDLVRVEKQMLKSIEQFYDLFLYLIVLIQDIHHQAELNLERNKEKILATKEDINPNTRFIDNKLIQIINSNYGINKLIESKKINWQLNTEDVKKLWKTIRDSDVYDQYMNGPYEGFESDKKFILKIFRRFISEADMFTDILQEKNMYWYIDQELASINIQKLISKIKEDELDSSNLLPSLYKDEKEDVVFIKKLLRKCAAFNEEYEKAISEKTRNWEIERIAKLDILFLKMALTEFEHFNEIPLKVSLNEYIELAKNFSTPNSKNFINGILDRFVSEWKKSKKINKTGRGLL